MTAKPLLPIEEIVRAEPAASPSPGIEIGRSREDRPLIAHRLGEGPRRISLIAGCHADEPVGPAMLARLTRHLASAAPNDPLLERFTWLIVPHVNPDGAARNAAWVDRTSALADHRGDPDVGYQLAPYLQRVVRELPGDDVEFGFPRGADDDGARPENRAVARFLATGAPFVVHGSFHGMGLAPGPWFLIEPAWVDRSGAMRERLRERVRTMGYSLFDIDRRGEKGFRRIDRGFSTRPDSRAMIEFFRDRGEPGTAERFRPSSMELARALGGDPFTLVSEMPLFLYGPERHAEADPSGLRKLRERLLELLEERPGEFAAEVRRLGIRPMPRRDQMRLQLAFLDEALRTALGGQAGG